jgi:hypothetical protein
VGGIELISKTGDGGTCAHAALRKAIKVNNNVLCICVLPNKIISFAPAFSLMNQFEE